MKNTVLDLISVLIVSGLLCIGLLEYFDVLVK